MLSRRTLLRGGLAAATYGLLRTRGFAAPPAIPPGAGFRQLASSPPLLRLPRLSPSILVDGLPFLPGYLGDYFDDQQIPFHVPENQFANGAPPAATENVDVAIVGGGLSGLMTAYLLRRFHPVVLDYQPRFGGTSMGEEWSGLKFSLGGAYFMNPDPGSELEQLYEELELDRAYRLDSGENPTELDGAIQDDFWDADDLPPDQRLRFQQYRETVQYFANEQYPDIPLDESADNDWILDLDRLSFRQHIEQRLGGALPPRLASAIQGYFVSSFGASWDEVSAAGGWNFVAAEESGRWVMPGGECVCPSDSLATSDARDVSDPRRRCAAAPAAVIQGCRCPARQQAALAGHLARQ